MISEIHRNSEKWARCNDWNMPKYVWSSALILHTHSWQQHRVLPILSGEERIKQTAFHDRGVENVCALAALAWQKP